MLTKKYKKTKGFVPILGIVIIGVIVLAVAGIILIFVLRGTVPPLPHKVNLKMWGVWDNQSDWASIISSYKSLHPYVSITYEKFRYAEYEKELVNAWARQEGPDIYALPSSWLGKYKNDFIAPMPKTTKMAYYRKVKTLGIKEETKVEYKTQNTVSLNYLKSNFVSTVYNDAVINNNVYGLPATIDTLVLFYNKDLLDAAHIPQPPATWQEFVNNVKQLTILDTNNNIIQSGTALGTANNVPYAMDILSLIMMQYGTAMSTGNAVTFNSPEGLEALNFYSYFANPGKEVYCWNENMPDALDSFANGKVAFFFGYPYQVPDIKQRGPRLNYGISSFPQITPEKETNYADYWLQTVSKNSTAKNEAWDFIVYATDAKNVTKYLKATGKASVLRSIISDQVKDPYVDLYIFAKQALNAKTWYHGADPQQAEEYFDEMINSVVKGTEVADKAISIAAKRIQSTYKD